MRIENWSIVYKPDPYVAPEARRPRLSGTVTGHPLHPDGAQVTTSRIVAVEGGLIITSSGSRYQLGAVNPLYESQFPGAVGRLFKGL